MRGPDPPVFQFMCVVKGKGVGRVGIRLKNFSVDFSEFLFITMTISLFCDFLDLKNGSRFCCRKNFRIFFGRLRFSRPCSPFGTVGRGVSRLGSVTPGDPEE